MSTQIEQAAARASEPRAGEMRHDPIGRLEQILIQHQGLAQGIHDAMRHKAPRVEFIDLTPAAPTQTAPGVSAHDPVQGIGAINTSAVAVAIGWPGFSAGNGMGLTVPANGYLRVPVQSLNRVDVSCPSFAGLGEVSVILLEYEYPPELAGGSLTSSGGAGGSTAAAVTASSPRTVAVATSSALALAANPSRKGSLWENTGTTNVSLGLGAAAVVGDDIVLEPGGTWNGMVGAVTWTGAVYAIAATSASSLSVVEV